MVDLETLRGLWRKARRLMWYLPQAAKMEQIAETGVDPETVTVLVSQDAYAIFAGMCALTMFCILIWLFVWIRKL